MRKKHRGEGSCKKVKRILQQYIRVMIKRRRRKNIRADKGGEKERAFRG